MVQALDFAERETLRRSRRFIEPSPVTEPARRIILPHRLPILNVDGTAQRDSVTGALFRDPTYGGVRRNAWGTNDPTCCCVGSGYPQSGSGSGSGGPLCPCNNSGSTFLGNLTITVTGSFTGGTGCFATTDGQGFIVTDPSIAGTVCAQRQPGAYCNWLGVLNVFNADFYATNDGYGRPLTVGQSCQAALGPDACGNATTLSCSFPCSGLNVGCNTVSARHIQVLAGFQMDNAGAGTMVVELTGLAVRCNGSSYPSLFPFGTLGSISTPFTCGDTKTVSFNWVVPAAFITGCPPPTHQYTLTQYYFTGTITVSDSGC